MTSKCDTNNSKEKTCNALQREQFQIKKTKDQFFSTKCSHSEPVMILKLHTTQIFKAVHMN